MSTRWCLSPLSLWCGPGLAQLTVLGPVSTSLRSPSSVQISIGGLGTIPRTPIGRTFSFLGSLFADTSQQYWEALGSLP